ncbi:aminotransferase class IV [Pseudonocardia xishanensis]|uniref:Branched-chain-amino-acid transaminase n=1 Tax=Pseudonocardia xishanensis TaxID=630995 RepID=A0ABP8S207_9PSEU
MAHTASLSQLQTPRWAQVNGELVPYGDVRIHIGAEALTRALSVFEGVKGYWDDSGETFALRSPRRHYERLCRSARLLHVPVRFGYDEYVVWLARLGAELAVPDRDLWFRTTLYVIEGHWGEGTVADLVTTAYTQTTAEPAPMRAAVSTWRRGGDSVLPARIKSAANYVMGRVARIEANRAGADEAVLLNESGRVAEATGACVVIVDRSGLVTPPPAEGCLDSITVDALEELCGGLGIPFSRRPVERTELLTARECGLVGTITELTPVAEVDGYTFALDGLLADVRRHYLGVMRGRTALACAPLVPLLHRAGEGIRPIGGPLVGAAE